MEIHLVLKLSQKDLAEALKTGSVTVHAGDTAPAEAAKKRGRPAKKAEPEDDEDDAEDDEDEAPAKKRGRPAKKAEPEDDEDDDEESSEDDEDGDDEEPEDAEDDEDGDDEDEDDEDFVTGADLAKVKNALQAYSKAKKSKDAAVKVLRKFAPSSEKVKTGDLAKLLKALKV